MARIRTVKPEFWTDEKTGTLSDFAKCLFIGLLNLSDDYGVVRWTIEEWRVKLFPYHPAGVVGAREAITHALVAEILPKALAEVFSFADDDKPGVLCLFIRNFTKHQVINRPSKPTFNGWQKHDNPKTYAKRLKIDFHEYPAGPDAPEAHGALTEHSRSTH